MSEKQQSIIEKPSGTTETAQNAAYSPVDRFWVIDKFGILILSAFSYFLAYTHEVAYCRMFGVPIYLVRPDVATILHFFTLLMGLFMLGTAVIHTWHDHLSDNSSKSPHGHLLSLYIPAFFTAMFFWVAGGLRKWPGIIIGGLFVLFLLIDLLGAYTKSEKPITKKFLLKMEGMGAFLDASFLGPYRKMMPRHAFFCLVLAYFMYLTSQEMGVGEAQNQKLFHILSTRNESFVVRSYGDKIITSSIDPETKTVLGDISILTAGADPALKLIPKEIGPLNFDKPKPKTPKIESKVDPPKDKSDANPKIQPPTPPQPLKSPAASDKSNP